MITKKECMKVAGKNNCYYPMFNIFLFNCVLKGIIDYDLLTLNEKKSLNRILSGEIDRIYYNKKAKRILMDR